jgi:hypothetical protein
MQIEPLADSSPRYVTGWRFAEWWLSRGGGVDADPCENWTDAQANGFCDRLYEERVR